MPVSLEEYLQLHPADLADRLQRLDADDAHALLQQLPAKKVAAALAEVEQDRLPDFLGTFDAVQLAEILTYLAPDVAADLLQQLSAGIRRDALAKLPDEFAEGVRKLLRYPEDTAGGVMTNRFIALRDEMTVEEVRELLRDRAQEERTEDIAYLYVTDA
ncbi:MAG: magnesium transporter, partial [Chthoniobacterales bacterium]